MSETTLTLSADESARLGKNECVIRAGMSTFIEVGNALQDIRDNRLYRRQYGTFEEYCEVKWGWTRQRVNQLIVASDVANNLETNGCQIADLNERQARELSKVAPDQQPQVWKEAVETSGGQPTAKTVAAVVAKSKPAETQIISKGLKRLNQQRELDVITNHICKYEEAFPSVDSYELLIADLETHIERLKEHLATLTKEPSKQAA